MIRNFRDVLQVLVWSIVVLIGLWGAAYLFTWYTWDYAPSHAYDHLLVPQVERITHVAFPDGSKVLHSAGYSWLRPSLWAVVEIDPGKLQEFTNWLRKNSYSFSRTKKQRPNGITDAPEITSEDWWRKDSARKFISAKRDRGTQSDTTILIDLDDPRRPLVYISYCYG